MKYLVVVYITNLLCYLQEGHFGWPWSLQNADFQFGLRSMSGCQFGSRLKAGCQCWSRLKAGCQFELRLKAGCRSGWGCLEKELSVDFQSGLGLLLQI